MSTPIEASEFAADKPDVHTDGDEEREEREEGGDGRSQSYRGLPNNAVLNTTGAGQCKVE